VAVPGASSGLDQHISPIARLLLPLVAKPAKAGPVLSSRSASRAASSNLTSARFHTEVMPFSACAHFLEQAEIHFDRGLDRYGLRTDHPRLKMPLLHFGHGFGATDPDRRRTTSVDKPEIYRSLHGRRSPTDQLTDIVRAHLLMAGMVAALWMALTPARAQEVTKENVDGIVNFRRMETTVARSGQSSQTRCGTTRKWASYR